MKVRFIKRPSLAVLNQILSQKFNKQISVKMLDDGIQLEGDLNIGDIQRLEMMFERWGYLLDES